MARVQFAEEERDQNFQIEDGIARLLQQGETAEIDTSIIQENYDLLERVDHGDIATPFHRLSRHDQLIANLHDRYDLDDAEYEVQDDITQFRRKPK